ncbi:MAG: carbohydrate ABC transporter permease [Endomicrobiia bacterium]|nr:carbohydrate ABC transporter permease [Endomicrobiaceae bacterium]MDD3053665.1 carbohydrate ABC transporter permease [Endomicrobiaceae bacterium]MDD3923090.1 carbohydrate ABC transporter permease [Endomicrobiaceae bacterium]MDD5101577.1 carbohydrate ABC transporter permease [Endomicrobiaceae bacterium]
MNSFKTKKQILDFITHAILLVVAVTCIFPVFWMLSSSLKTQEEIFTKMTLLPEVWQWSNYVDAFIKAEFGMYFLNSIIYTVVGVSAIVLVTSMAAYGFARLEFWGKNFLFYLLISTLLIPIPGVFVPLYLLLKKLSLLDTRTGLLLCYISGALAFGLFLLRSFFEDLPKEIEEAALIDGCSRFGIYWRIALPLAKPAIATLVILQCLAIWNEFLLALVVLQDKAKMPIQRGLMVFQGTFITDYPLLMAGLTIATIPIVIVYLLMQKHIVKGIAAGALKG